ncbi:hypothetical protein Y032_0344g3090 [Ancylostoma ceylanicum]|uniref:Phlebovirus glycoprotein G2 fusion domain-containing protein n=1 Tax=Ancylostoma ceylanicum TaxID=53326 RepID=A0A016RXH4_9BILA|nr:hypothetical protein Y032_0344g3090 [Ancylostoma ceylanicum]
MSEALLGRPDTLPQLKKWAELLGSSAHRPHECLRRYIENSQLQLPLAAKDVVKLQRGNDPQAKTTSGSSTSVQVSMRGLTILTKRLNNECQIDIGSPTGCFSCIQGARLQASCTSSLAEETAEIHCGNQTQFAMCSPHSKISELVFHFATSSINMNCSVICPAGQSMITIQGPLDYVNNALFQPPIQQVDTHRRTTSSGSSLDTIFHALSTILSPIANVLQYWKMLVAIIIASCIILPLLRFMRTRSI